MGLQRVHFAIDIGEGAEDYQVIAAKEKLSQLEVQVRKLIDKATQIKKEQDFQRVLYLYKIIHSLISSSSLSYSLTCA